MKARVGVVLAGGRSRRMGGSDKAWEMVAGKPMIEHVVDALKPVVDRVLIVANHQVSRHARLADEVLSDLPEAGHGPLAGVVTALSHLVAHDVLITACDLPALTTDTWIRLLRYPAPSAHLRCHGDDVLCIKLDHDDIQRWLEQGCNTGSLFKALRALGIPGADIDVDRRETANCNRPVDIEACEQWIQSR